MSRTFVGEGGRRVPLSNLEKDLYPSYGFTKAGILEYYRRTGPFILPHLRDRALTFKRYPDGVEKDHFFEKRCPVHRPAWVQTADIVTEGKEPMKVCLVNDLETLLWAENLASVELHVPLARAGSAGTADFLVFDLDPGEEAGVLEAGRVALILRELLARMGLASHVKTSGRKGLHVYVPLNTGESTFGQTRTFSRSVAIIMEKHYPGLVTSRMPKEERRGKIFINWSQNDARKTMVCVYSLRAEKRPFVSFPLAWEELQEGVGKGDRGMLQITPAEAVRRTEARGDLFREVLAKEQRLPHLDGARK
jgi:bifunctional non-homologous end joining protein LigD